MALARSEQSSQRFYSMSAQIRLERKAYYEILERPQRGSIPGSMPRKAMDITLWLEWFLGCLGRAIERAHTVLNAVLTKARFWDEIEAAAADRRLGPLNDRQRFMLNRLLDAFEGKLTSSKWAKLTKCSQDTAYRDLADLIERGILVRDAGGGRSTSYSLRKPDELTS